MNGSTVSNLAALRAMIARSPIHIPRTPAKAPLLPHGFDAADLAILEWIAAEYRLTGRRLAA